MQPINLLMASVAFVMVLVALYFLLFKVPSTENQFVATSKDLDPTLKKLVKALGPDILALAPKDYFKKKNLDREIDLLLRKSGNPWDVGPAEFFLIKFCLLAAGLLAGVLLGIIVGALIWAPIGVLLGILLPVIGYIAPNTIYEGEAKKRELHFKKALPESIDLLIMALSGGNFTLINGIEEIIPHMDPSPIKDEFIKITQDVDSGMSVSEGLANFAERVPTHGIKAFVKALINANELSVDMTTILKARAKESRKELRYESEKKIMALPTKVMGVLSPSSAICVLVLALAPSAYTLMQIL